MNLREALLSSSLERIRGIAGFYGLWGLPGSPGGEANLDAIADLVNGHLLVPAHALVAMNGLNQEEILALRLITIAAGGSGVVVEQCHQKLNQLSRKWRRNGAKVIDALISRGLVFTRREGYRHVYFVPSDLKEVLSGFFLSDIYQASLADGTRFSPRHRTDFAAPLRHTCLFLSYLRKNEIRLTQSSTMFKKAQNDLTLLIEEEETPMEESFFPVRYPPRLAFLLYFGRSKGLIEERNGLLRLSPSAATWVVDTEESQCRQDLFDYWKNTFIAQDTDLQTLLWVLMRAPEGSVLSMTDLLSYMETLSTSHSSHGLNLRAERNLVDILEYLGGLDVQNTLNAVNVRPTPLGRAMFGLSPWPEEAWDNHIYVQSNFETLVPCTVAPKLLWSIDAFADLQKPDQMMVYKLSRNSVYRAMLHSYTPEMIERFLETYSKTPVAQNVAYSISHWGTSYGRIEFEETILLKCDTEELADELMLHPKIRPYLRQKVGPCYLTVDGAQYEQLVVALSDEGYMPKVDSTRRLAPQT